MSTRILSVFSFLKRVGFAVLLLGSLDCGFSEWGNQVVLWSNQQGVMAGGSESDIAVDGLGRAHIAFYAQFRYSQDHTFLHKGIYYCCVDTLGNLLVPATLLTDSGYWDVSVPKILLFEPDSIWVMAKSSDANFESAYRYVTLSWDGSLISRPQVFETCTEVHAIGWDLVSAPDRTVALLLPDRQTSASIKIIVQEPDGSRPIDCELAWDVSLCDKPLGYIDHSDSLQLFWRQGPGWNAIYTKRIGIRDHISSEVVGQFHALSPELPGYLQAATRVVELGDTAFLIREDHAEDDFGDFVRTLRRDSYETISTARVSTGYINADEMSLSNDTTISLLVSPRYPVYLVQNRSISDLSVVSESDSLILANVVDSQQSSGYTSSRFGHHHVTISTSSSDGAEGEAQLLYQMWKLGEFTETACGPLVSLITPMLFPNPTNGDIFLALGNHFSGIVKVYNLLGQVVHVHYLSGSAYQQSITRLQLHDIASGIYFLSLEQPNGIQVQKFIVQR